MHYLLLDGGFLQLKHSVQEGSGSLVSRQMSAGTENWNIYEGLTSSIRSKQLLGLETGKPSFREKRFSDCQATLCEHRL